MYTALVTFLGLPQEIRLDAVFRQARALGRNVLAIPLPDPCSNEEYTARVVDALGLLGGVERVRRLVFGDLGLLDLREWREAAFMQYVCAALFLSGLARPWPCIARRIAYPKA
jgi:hypothetical protein